MTEHKPDFTLIEVRLFMEAPNDDTQLILEWDTRSAGFGLLSFFVRDGELWCDNECMSRAFCKRVLDKFVSEVPPGQELPPLLRNHATTAALLEVCKPTQSWD